MLRRALGPAVLVIVVAVVGWLITGVAVLDVIKFLAYDAAFVALPGAALLWAIRGRRTHFLLTIALGWPLGQTLEILAFSATAWIGVRGLFLLYPIVVIVPSALVIYRRRTAVQDDPDPAGMSRTLMWSVAAALSVGIVYLTIMLLPQAPLPASSVVLEYPDFPYFIGLIEQVMNHWPPTSPGLAGIALHYEWFVFFHMAAASQVTRLPVAIIALRLDYVPTIVVVGCQLLAVGRFIGGAAWTGALAVGVLFLMGPLGVIAHTNGTPFGDGVLINLWNSWTFPFGLMFFLPLLYLITERLRSATWRTSSDLRSWILMALLMIGGSGAKATVLPVIVVGTGLYMVLHLVFRRSAPVAAVVSAGLGIVLFVITYAIIYAGTAPDTVISFMMWLNGTPPVVFAEGIQHTLLREILLPFAFAAGLAGFLLPLSGILYLFRRRHRSELPAFVLPLCMLAGGIFIACVVHQISFSEGYFEETGYAAGAIAAGGGLRLAWVDAGRALPISRRGVAVAFACWLVVLIAAGKILSQSIIDPRPTMYFYAGFVAVSVLFVIVWALVAQARRRAASGALALGLIPLVAAAVVTTPLTVYPTVRKMLSGVPTISSQVVLTPGLVTALQWLQNHSSVNAVFAVNNHWLDAAMGNGKYFYYTAFSDRQVFIEAYDPIRYGVTPGIASPVATAFAERQMLNNAVFEHADAAALQTMTSQYAVQFLFIDRLHGVHNSAVLQLGRVVYSNADATILAVG
jgi:hypothetical protein